MKIGITGATGQLGRIVVNKLKDKLGAQHVIALVRSVDKADLEVESRHADYDKTETLESALTGIDALLLISGSEMGKRVAQHQNVIAAAKKNGVQWIIYTSLLHADVSTISLAGEHLATEAALRESGIPYTLLRNGWYSENYVGSIHGAIVTGALLGSVGNGRISAATRQDYAEGTVAVLTSEGQQGKVFELAGSESFTLADLAAEISRQTGKDIPYINLPEVEFAASLTTAGVPEGLAQMLAAIDISAEKGDLFDDGNQLSLLIGRPTTPISAIVSEALGSA